MYLFIAVCITTKDQRLSPPLNSKLSQGRTFWLNPQWPVQCVTRESQREGSSLPKFSRMCLEESLFFLAWTIKETFQWLTNYLICFLFFFFLEPSQQRYLEHWLSRQVLHELLKESRVALWTDPSLEPVTLGSHCRSTTCQLFMALRPELHFSISQPPLLQARIVKFLAYSGSVINGSSCY